jgi:hypothetical protein
VPLISIAEDKLLNVTEDAYVFELNCTSLALLKVASVELHNFTAVIPEAVPLNCTVASVTLEPFTPGSKKNLPKALLFVPLKGVGAVYEAPLVKATWLETVGGDGFP